MNRWIADRGYGSGMALAFEGDADFIRQSSNFAYNFLFGSSRAAVSQVTPSFAVVNTSMEQLVEALENEGALKKELELRSEYFKANGRDVDLMEEEDFPADFEEKMRAYSRAILAASTPEQVKEAEKLNLAAGLDRIDEDTLAEWKKEMKEAGRIHAQDVVSKLHFEDFMQRISHAGLHTHAYSEQST